MWNNIQKQHKQQLTIVQRLINIKTRISHLPDNKSECNSKNIEKIYLQVTNWRFEFEKLTNHKSEYIKSLNNWLKLNLTCIDHNVRSQNSKIESLLRTWNDRIEKLPEEGVKTAIRSFSCVVVTSVRYHEEEMKLKERCDEIRQEITRKTRKFEEWCDKQIAKRMPSDEMDVDVMDDMNLIAEQQVVVEVLKRLLEEAEEVYQRHRVKVKEMAVLNLTAALPEVFTAMAEFSGACTRMYESLESRQEDL
ncbi:hypothetical protein HanRHA438_Chr02g0048761 [Helianthus annuus]|nr:hypothetical protein HanHA300_Chr02g0038951 [Helianthus annuus]KAJ0938337.1 hypothetical protein HanRHA438_Chr02g0048761 [Helianthus annuus]